MEGHKGEKNWDNCNSIINKTYLKTKIKNFQDIGETRITFDFNKSVKIIKRTFLSRPEKLCQDKVS